MVSAKALEELARELRDSHLFTLEAIQTAMDTRPTLGAELLARTRVAQFVLDRIEETQGLVLDPDPEPETPTTRRQSADEAFEEL